MHSLQVKFEELLGTWRTGSANQTELFDPDIQRRIEENVFGNWRRNDSIASQAFLNGVSLQTYIVILITAILTNKFTRSDHG